MNLDNSGSVWWENSNTSSVLTGCSRQAKLCSTNLSSNPILFSFDALVVLTNLTWSTLDEITRTGTFSDSKSVFSLTGLTFKSLAHILTIPCVSTEFRSEDGNERIWTLLESGISAWVPAAWRSKNFIGLASRWDTFTILTNFIQPTSDEIARASSLSDSNDLSALTGLAFKSIADILPLIGIGTERWFVNLQEVISALWVLGVRTWTPTSWWSFVLVGSTDQASCGRRIS